MTCESADNLRQTTRICKSRKPSVILTPDRPRRVIDIPIIDPNAPEHELLAWKDLIDEEILGITNRRDDPLSGVLHFLKDPQTQLEIPPSQRAAVLSTTLEPVIPGTLSREAMIQRLEATG